MRKDLKPQASFSSTYWEQSADIARLSRRAVQLETELQERHHHEQGAEGDFSRSLMAARLRERLRALEADERVSKSRHRC